MEDKELWLDDDYTDNRSDEEKESSEYRKALESVRKIPNKRLERDYLAIDGGKNGKAELLSDKEVRELTSACTGSISKMLEYSVLYDRDTLTGMAAKYISMKESYAKRSLGDEITLGMLRLIASVARHYPTAPFEDAMSYGLEGLAHALNSFEPDKGCSFSSYAYWWIKRDIMRWSYREHYAVKIPEDVNMEVARFNKAVSDAQAAGKIDFESAFPGEIAEAIGWSADKVSAMLQVRQFQTMVSLDAPTNEDNERGDSMIDRYESIADNAETPEQKVEREELYKLILRDYREYKISDEEMYILQQHGDFPINEAGDMVPQPKKYREIAIELGKSEALPRQAARRAFIKMQKIPIVKDWHYTTAENKVQTVAR